MIVIKIKTWNDWKKDFIDWIKEPRRTTCKEYVDYMEALEKESLYKVINNVCDKYNNMTEEQIHAISNAVEICVADCAKTTHKLIDDCIPIKFF